MNIRCQYAPAFLLPVVCLALMVWLFIAETNEILFLSINQSYLHFDVSTWDFIWQNITFLGDSLLVIALLLPLAVRHRALVMVILYAILSTTLIVQALKLGLQIPRPLMLMEASDIHTIGASVHKRSFPSGHTAAAFVFTAVLIRYFRANPWVNGGLLGLAALVGVSRVVVSAHWPMDVLAGAAIGWLCGCWSVAFMKRKGCSQVGCYRWGMSTLFFATLYLLLFHSSGYPLADVLQTMVAVFSLCLSAYYLWKYREVRHA